MKKHRRETTHLHRFDCQPAPYQELKSHEERRYIAFVDTYCKGVLNADPAAAKLTIEDLKAALADIGKAFPEDNYWLFESYKNEILIRRGRDRKLCATIIVRY